MMRTKPVTIDGAESPSQAAAARALGISPQAVWLRVHPEYKRQVYPHSRAERDTLLRRWVKVSQGEVKLATLLLPRFPHCKTIDDLFAYAIHKLAESTGD
jgi:hypothetical protein